MSPSATGTNGIDSNTPSPRITTTVFINIFIDTDTPVITMLSASRLALNTARRTAGPAMGAVRNLNVHEYISMEIMKNHGIKTPECYVASTPDEAEHIFTSSLNKGKYSGAVNFEVRVWVGHCTA